MKHLFIVNPAAGGRDRSADVTAAVQRTFTSRRGDFEIYITRAPMDALKKIQYEADLCDELRVYACGGDGTLNECVCGAAGRENVAVTHYPTGTGNDFTKTFGAESGLFRSLDALVGGAVRRLDAIDCNGRPCINICSVGIDARIGGDVHKYSALPLIGGATGYVTSTAVNLLKGVTDELEVFCGGRVYYGKMSLVCCCNGGWYGGGFHPAPEARPDDGLLDFLIVRGVSRLKFIRLVGSYAKGGHAKYPEYITHVRGDSMEIKSPKELAVNVDGELLRARHIRLKLLPGAVNFLVPAGMKYFAEKKEEIFV